MAASYVLTLLRSTHTIDLCIKGHKLSKGWATAVQGLLIKVIGRVEILTHDRVSAKNPKSVALTNELTTHPMQLWNKVITIISSLELNVYKTLLSTLDYVFFKLISCFTIKCFLVIVEFRMSMKLVNIYLTISHYKLFFSYFNKQIIIISKGIGRGNFLKLFSVILGSCRSHYKASIK